MFSEPLLSPLDPAASEGEVAEERTPKEPKKVLWQYLFNPLNTWKYCPRAYSPLVWNLELEESWLELSSCLEDAHFAKAVLPKCYTSQPFKTEMCTDVIADLGHVLTQWGSLETGQ
ncbi:unnamed protein product [Caretta caretta]